MQRRLLALGDATEQGIGAVVQLLELIAIDEQHSLVLVPLFSQFDRPIAGFENTFEQRLELGKPVQVLAAKHGRSGEGQRRL
ncbi:hypothetical protein D3C76_1100840 [compost metagenome]